MEPIKISTPEQAMVRLRQAVRAKDSNFVYNPDGDYSCHYFEDDDRQTLADGVEPADLKPGCIIGQMLADAGFDPAAEPEVAKDIEGQDVKTLAGANPYYVSQGGLVLIEAPPLVVEMLAQAQTAQDEGQSWGESLRVARAIQRGAELAQVNA